MSETTPLLFKKDSNVVRSNSTSSTLSDESSDFFDPNWGPSEHELKERDTKWFKFKLFFVDSLDKHPLERLYMWKLDFFLLSSAMFGYFIKSLNQQNIGVAYLNGMDEYYGMDKNQYNYLLSAWTVGYVLGQIPSNLMLGRLNARIYLGGLQVMWGVLCLLQIVCGSLHQLYFIRFLLGLSELAFFPGIQYILGSFYAPKELAKRSTLFSISSSVAGVLSPLIQQAILSNSDWRFHGTLQPFQVMFLINSLITIPIALYSMIALPNNPTRITEFYFNDTDKFIAVERRRRLGQTITLKSSSSAQDFKDLINSWHIFVFPLMFLAYNNSTGCHGQPTFQTWMKFDLNLPPSAYNVYPSLLTLAGIILAIPVAFLGDFLGGKLNYIFVSLVFLVTGTGCTLLAIWDIPLPIHWACYVIISLPSHWGQPQIFSWINRLLYQDDSKRNLVVVITNTLAYVTNAWVPILVWNTQDKPRYFVGFVYTSILCLGGLIMTILGRHLENKGSLRSRH